MRTCSSCNETKEPDAFFKDKNNQEDGRYSVCKVCKRKKTYQWRVENKAKYNADARKWRKNNPGNLYASEIKRRYGCSLEKYNELLVSQGGKCKLCDKIHNPLVKRERLYVDHCHNSLEIRGLLCGACNSMLGYAKDNVETLLKAIQYLKKDC